MHDQTTFGRFSAISAILSAPLALLSTFIAIAAVGFNFDLLDEPAGLIKLGSGPANLFAWSWILAALGFYLLLVPAALYLDDWLKSKKPNLLKMYTVFGLSYIFIGTIDLLTMVTVLSPMMRAYADAQGPQREVLVVVFQPFANLAFADLSTLTFILGGIWWLGIGRILTSEKRVLGIITVNLGVATFGSGLGYLFQFEPLARLEVFNYFLGPIWALWLGVVIWRRAKQREAAIQPATVAERSGGPLD